MPALKGACAWCGFRHRLLPVVWEVVAGGRAGSCFQGKARATASGRAGLWAWLGLVCGGERLHRQAAHFHWPLCLRLEGEVLDFKYCWVRALTFTFSFSVNALSFMLSLHSLVRCA